MGIRIDENTIFEDGRKKKISEANAEPMAKAEPKDKPETEAEPKTGKVSEKAEKKTSSKGKEARA